MIMMSKDEQPESEQASTEESQNTSSEESQETDTEETQKSKHPQCPRCGSAKVNKKKAPYYKCSQGHTFEA